MSRPTDLSNNTLSQLLDVTTLIERELEQSGGELTPQIEVLLGLTETLTADKVDHTEYVIKKLEAESAFLKERANEFLAASKARANASDRIRERIKHLMLTHEKTELLGEYVRFVLSPSIPSLVVEDETQIPVEYKKIVTTAKLDNAAIKAALQTGTPVKGAHLQESFSLRSYASTGSKKLGAK